MENTIKTRFNREELIKELNIENGEITVLGAVAFDLPYDKLKEIWFKGIHEGKLVLRIVCESEPTLSYDSLISSDRRISGEDNNFELEDFNYISSEPVRNLKRYLERKECNNLEPGNDSKQCLFIKTYYIAPKIPIIRIINNDEKTEKVFIGMALTKFNHLEKFELLTKEHFWYEELKKYIDAFLTPNKVEKFSTEFTFDGKHLEVLEMYNEKRIAMGQLPRESFSDISSVKNVVWAMIFSRDGKLLLHKRSKNAKDNRGMWDKSVGGHVDIEKDIDTAKAGAREIVEELYEEEKEGQGGHGDNKKEIVNADYLIYLGEWRPDFRFDQIYNTLTYDDKYMYYLRMNPNGFSREVQRSPRINVDGSKVNVRVFVDFFVCVADKDFSKHLNDKTLKNSSYALLYPSQIKDLYFQNKYIDDNGKENTLDKNDKFIPTPDLENIINSSLWGELSSFSNILKNSQRNKDCID